MVNDPQPYRSKRGEQHPVHDVVQVASELLGRRPREVGVPPPEVLEPLYVDAQQPALDNGLERDRISAAGCPRQPITSPAFR